jgi:hypothetical protein
MDFNLEDLTVGTRTVLQIVSFLLGFGLLVVVLCHYQFVVVQQSGRSVSIYTEVGDLIPRMLIPCIFLVIGVMLRLNKVVGPAWSALVALCVGFVKLYSNFPSFAVILLLFIGVVLFSVLQDIWKNDKLYGDIAWLLAGALGSRAVDTVMERFKETPIAGGK